MKKNTQYIIFGLIGAGATAFLIFKHYYVIAKISIFDISTNMPLKRPEGWTDYVMPMGLSEKLAGAEVTPFRKIDGLWQVTGSPTVKFGNVTAFTLPKNSYYQVSPLSPSWISPDRKTVMAFRFHHSFPLLEEDSLRNTYAFLNGDLDLKIYLEPYTFNLGMM